MLMGQSHHLTLESDFGPLPALVMTRKRTVNQKEEQNHGNRDHRASDPVRCRPRSGHRPVHVPADATLQGDRPFQLRSRQRFRNRLPPPRAQPPVRTISSVAPFGVPVSYGYPAFFVGGFRGARKKGRNHNDHRDQPHFPYSFPPTNHPPRHTPP